MMPYCLVSQDEKEIDYVYKSERVVERGDEEGDHKGTGLASDRPKGCSIGRGEVAGEL